MSPPPLNTAEAQLVRLLWLIPAASRPGGIALEEAAGTLDVPVAQIQRDVEALTERVFYHPAGTAEGLMIELTDRLKIHTTGQFGRPPRLTPRELFCVVLGLRMSPGDHTALVRKLEERLAFRSAAAGAGAASPSGGASPSEAAQEPFHIPDLQDAWSADVVLDVLRQGWRTRQPVAFGYLKPGEAAPEVRRLHCHGL
ncbi:MAG TPA: hypothetical protein VLA43_19225, partial [Longimicrobiales bacterium]|nr:hypothetical protein [Longimicrobiales bacterium]